jgi:hypothetical protein
MGSDGFEHRQCHHGDFLKTEQNDEFEKSLCVRARNFHAQRVRFTHHLVSVAAFGREPQIER